ncbi:MAG: outer membrane protein [Roseivirga sp.]|jgi:outer membrane protein
MKNLSTILSSLALIGVIYLLIQGSGNENASGESQTKEVVAKSAGGLNLAFVDTDSLVSKYDYHQELKAKLEGRAQNMEADLASKSKAFQENITILEQQAGNMSPQQIQQAQAELQQKQQELMMYRDEQSQALSREEQELTLLLKEDMDNLLDSLKVEMGYDFIFSFDPTSSVLAANPEWDITDIVVEGLNKAYAAKKSE